LGSNGIRFSKRRNGRHLQGSGYGSAMSGCLESDERGPHGRRGQPKSTPAGSSRGGRPATQQCRLGYHLAKDEEQFFYAMEFIDGETTEAYVMRCDPITVRSALRVAWQVSKALVAAARQQLVAHGDRIILKTVMVTLSRRHHDRGGFGSRGLAICEAHRFWPCSVDAASAILLPRRSRAFWAPRSSPALSRSRRVR
jgi:hypothetical protein